MNIDIRWHQRFENLGKALNRLREALAGIAEDPKNHLYQIALIGAFQFTFELSWKTMKDYLAYSGVDTSLPRDVLKQAFHHELIHDGQIWIDMLEDRNIMAHVYEEKAAIKAAKSILENYAPAIERVYKDLFERRNA